MICWHKVVRVDSIVVGFHRGSEKYNIDAGNYKLSENMYFFWDTIVCGSNIIDVIMM